MQHRSALRMAGHCVKYHGVRYHVFGIKRLGVWQYDYAPTLQSTKYKPTTITKGPTMTDPLSTITLRTGAVVPLTVFRTASMLIDSLLGKGVAGVTAAFDLYQRAKDPTYELNPNIAEMLISSGLLKQDGSLHDIDRDIVLASFDMVDGDDFSFCRVRALPTTDIFNS